MAIASRPNWVGCAGRSASSTATDADWPAEVSAVGGAGCAGFRRWKRRRAAPPAPPARGSTWRRRRRSCAASASPPAAPVRRSRPAGRHPRLRFGRRREGPRICNNTRFHVHRQMEHVAHVPFNSIAFVRYRWGPVIHKTNRVHIAAVWNAAKISKNKRKESSLKFRCESKNETVSNHCGRCLKDLKKRLKRNPKPSTPYHPIAWFDIVIGSIRVGKVSSNTDITPIWARRI